jgi:hypothetical protein
LENIIVLINSFFELRCCGFQGYDFLGGLSQIVVTDSTNVHMIRAPKCTIWRPEGGHSGTSSSTQPDIIIFLVLNTNFNLSDDVLKEKK